MLKLQNYTYELTPRAKRFYNCYGPTQWDILSFVSHPGYNINLFARGISSKDYNKLLKDKAKPLFNRALVGQYPSRFYSKPFLEL